MYCPSGEQQCGDSCDETELARNQANRDVHKARANLTLALAGAVLEPGQPFDSVRHPMKRWLEHVITGVGWHYGLQNDCVDPLLFAPGPAGGG